MRQKREEQGGGGRQRSRGGRKPGVEPTSSRRRSRTPRHGLGDPPLQTGPVDAGIERGQVAQHGVEGIIRLCVDRLGLIEIGDDAVLEPWPIDIGRRGPAAGEERIEAAPFVEDGGQLGLGGERGIDLRPQVGAVGLAEPRGHELFEREAVHRGYRPAKSIVGRGLT